MPRRSLPPSRDRFQNFIKIMVRKRIEIRVGADPVVDPAAEPSMNRLVERLSANVPTRHLEPRERSHDRRIGPLCKPRRIDAAKHQLDVCRRFALHVTLEDVPDDRLHGHRTDSGGIDFAHADDTACRRDLDEDKIAAHPSRAADCRQRRSQDRQASFLSRIEDDDVSPRRSGAGIGDRVVDSVERVTPRHQFIEHEPTLLIEVDEPGNVARQQHVTHL